MTKFSEGAEAIITLNSTLKTLEKSRKPKKYRHPELDKFLRKKRTKLEVKLLQAGEDLTPNPENINEYDFSMNLIEGLTLQQHLNASKTFPLNLGKKIYELHNKGIIHGDLTTSNIIINKSNEIKFIDFGLGQFSTKDEHRAVDLHLLKQILESEYPQNSKKYWSLIVDEYKGVDSNSVLKRLEQIELRGRYKKK